MKKILLKTLIIFLLLPMIIFVGCKDKKTLPAISVSKYFKNEITISRHGVSFDPTKPHNSTDTLSLLTQTEAKEENLSKYKEFKINAEPLWIYKMYIEKISFYVYCNESSESLLTINLSITDVASEDDIWNSSNENVETDTFSTQCTITPESRKPIKCNFPINRTVLGATGSTLTIDILNSLELYSSNEDNVSTFQWLIYGLEVHGESRAYTR